MSDSDIKVLGFAGSLRAGSYNRGLLRAAQKLAPSGMTVEVFDLTPIPMYNFDVEEKGDPEPVTAFKRAIVEADALLISTPEYQRGIPGVLKNALDWASRPVTGAPLERKIVATVGASPSMTGTARAQTQLWWIYHYNEMRVVVEPEILVAGADKKFDAQGNFIDEHGNKLLLKMLENIREAVIRWRTVDNAPPG